MGGYILGISHTIYPMGVILFGNHIWESHLEATFGSHIAAAKSYLGATFGSHIAGCCSGVIFGSHIGILFHDD